MSFEFIVKSRLISRSGFIWLTDAIITKNSYEGWTKVNWPEVASHVT
jgi:hypothetical protein